MSGRTLNLTQPSSPAFSTGAHKSVKVYFASYTVLGQLCGFSLTMLHEFLNTAKDQLEVLEGMYKKMTTMFKNTAKYFAFDPKKYTMEEFFSDLKAFIESFNVRVLFLL